MRHSYSAADCNNSPSKLKLHRKISKKNVLWTVMVAGTKLCSPCLVEVMGKSQSGGKGSS
jgi:hypothetical protein